ncbi:Rz1-like lysis system protein LysC [Chromohalobacter nigrandesensis]|uniref:Rz1-like lysis system protein LysC n=1 Tax=Chromohalobacter nigrandesensis TaxID=119863 RepID=UPI003CCFF00C
MTGLAGCASAPPSPAPPLIINQCSTPSPCTLPASHPTTNGELHLQLEHTEAAWAQCAAEVDAIIQCHEHTDEKTPSATHAPD